MHHRLRPNMHQLRMRLHRRPEIERSWRCQSVPPAVGEESSFDTRLELPLVETHLELLAMHHNHMGLPSLWYPVVSSIGPGASEFTRTPYCPHSLQRCLVMAAMAALALPAWTL